MSWAASHTPILMNVEPRRAPRERLDQLVVAQGLAPTRERAQSLILAGEVLVDGQRSTKPGNKIPIGALITLAEIPPALRYVSRGGLKLEGALDAFGLDPAGAIALDIGASTGGFTDVLLQRGAERVYAIDVGQGQLAWTLRSDPRVIVMERTNIRHLFHLPGEILGDCAAIDVSFISLRLVLPAVVRLLQPDAWIVALIKPQFEAGKQEADRGGGIIRDPVVHRRILTDLLDWCAKNGLATHRLIVSPITGREGNREYLIWLTRAGETSATTAISPEAIDLLID